MKKQPAKESYFYKDCYKQIFKAIAETFAQCFDVVSDSWDYLRDSVSETIGNLADVKIFSAFKNAFLSGLALGKLIMCALATPVLCFWLSLAQIIFVVFFAVLSTAWFAVIAVIDWCYGLIKRISTSCPNCQEKFALPNYVCECGAVHTKLKPSIKYGVFFRVCDCGKTLRTTYFNGKHKQKGNWLCPNCDYDLGTPLQRDIPILVVGGPSSGKTCYISQAIAQIEKNASPLYNLDFEYKENPALGDDYVDNKNAMSSGHLPLKTSDSRLRYYQFYLSVKKRRIRDLVSICDIAGESYDSTDEIGKQIGYKYANAFLMLVDPLSVTKYRQEVSQSIDVLKYGASNRAIDEILSTLIVTLENINCISSQSMIKTDVVVIFTKCDIPGLSEKIGDVAVQNYMASNGIKSKYEAQNKVCEQFLMDYDENNFLNSLKSKFKSIQFFTCSALGHAQDGTLFTPVGVEDPVLWLVDKASTAINLKDKWGMKL